MRALLPCALAARTRRRARAGYFEVLSLVLALLSLVELESDVLAFDFVSAEGALLLEVESASQCSLPLCSRWRFAARARAMPFFLS
jgi:hypothetical protein